MVNEEVIKGQAIAFCESLSKDEILSHDALTKALEGKGALIDYCKNSAPSYFTEKLLDEQGKQKNKSNKSVLEFCLMCCGCLRELLKETKCFSLIDEYKPLFDGSIKNLSDAFYKKFLDNMNEYLLHNTDRGMLFFWLSQDIEQEVDKQKVVKKDNKQPSSLFVPVYPPRDSCNQQTDFMNK